MIFFFLASLPHSSRGPFCDNFNSYFALIAFLDSVLQASSSPSSSSSFSSSLSSSSSSPSDSTSLTAGVSYVWPATHSIRHSQEEDASSSNLLLLRVGQRVQVVARKWRFTHRLVLIQSNQASVILKAFVSFRTPNLNFFSFLVEFFGLHRICLLRCELSEQN